MSEPAIRLLLDDFVRAIRDRDLDGVLSVFAPDVVSFDLGPPLAHGGGAEFRRRWQALFDAYRGPIDYEVRDLHVVAADDVAFTRSLNRIGGTLASGGRGERWLRWTACFEKRDGTWRIVHEHVSVPVEVRTAEAVLDATP